MKKEGMAFGEKNVRGLALFFDCGKVDKTSKQNTVLTFSESDWVYIDQQPPSGVEGFSVAGSQRIRYFFAKSQEGGI